MAVIMSANLTLIPLHFGKSTVPYSLRLMRLGGNTFSIIFHFQANNREMRTKAVLQTMDFPSYPYHDPIHQELLQGIRLYVPLGRLRCSPISTSLASMI